MPEQPSPGAGRPRLVVVPSGGHAPAGGIEAQGYQAEFGLQLGTTTIGSGPEQDIVLEGLDPAHAIVQWWEEGDEFVLQPLSADGSTTMNGAITAAGLHHGDRVELGGWTLVFQRDEDADHVRRNRTRQGGEYAGGGISEPGGHSTETE